MATASASRREGGVLAVAAQQFGVLGVAGGQQLGLQPEGDEPGGVGGVGGGDRGVAAATGVAGAAGSLHARVLGVVVAHGWVSSRAVVRWFGGAGGRRTGGQRVAGA